jgi:hypothetical protein
VVRLPGIAPGPSPWQEDILTVKPQPQKLKGPGGFSSLLARAISTKNKHRYGWSFRSHRFFTVVVSVFRGTPPPKPFRFKIRDIRLGSSSGDRWRHPVGGQYSFASAHLSFALDDII